LPGKHSAALAVAHSPNTSNRATWLSIGVAFSRQGRDGFDSTKVFTNILIPNVPELDMKPVAIFFGLWISVCCLLSHLQSVVGKLPEPPTDQTITEFSLKDLAGQTWDLKRLKPYKAVVVAFVGCECPLAKLYCARLQELQRQFPTDSVAWLLINSNQQDSLSDLKRFAKTNQIKLPLLKDPGNKVADHFDAQRTPETFLLDAKRVVRYRGRIDDQYTYGRQRPKPSQTELQDALNRLLANREIRVTRTEVPGCIIGREFAAATKADQTVTWNNQISRIMQANCQSCHRAGEIGPFELTDYREAVGWAGMIQEVVNQRRMPPWSANPAFGKWANDCRLSDEDISLINQWVNNGAPEGNPADLPPAKRFVTGWQIGQPDLIVPMSKKPFRVPATGTLEYKYFVVDPGFKEDKWITAAECRPDQRAVIHHIIVGVRGEGDFGQGVHDQVQSDWIAATAPGSPPMMLPPGYAKKIPAGRKLIFQMHYTPNGTAVDDLSSIGLKFISPQEVTHRVFTVKAANHRFRIPPGAENHPVKAQMRFDRDAELISLFPHMHLRGKAFRYTAKLPDGKHEVLLDVPRYDFNWQLGYEFKTRRTFPKGTQISCLAHFDNSDGNIANPDPTATVGWGDQTWEEMMIGYMNVALPKNSQ
jgi:peroxiredoxin